MLIHLYCCLAHSLAHILEACEAYEVSKIFDVSRVPLYFYYIYMCHFYELSQINGNFDAQESCDESQINMRNLWYIVELRVFYGYIIAGILFITVSQLFGINKKFREIETLSSEQPDFLEKYHDSLKTFCLFNLPGIGTLIIMIEFFTSNGDASIQI